jgi:Holliday junction resolvase-like predicted endonuclease
MKHPTTLPRTEGELQRWFVKELKKEGWLSFKFASPSKRGVPDLILIDPEGVVCFVEMKHPNKGGVLSPLQRVQIRKLKDANASVYIADSVEDCIGIVEGTKPEVRYAEL